MLIDNKIYGFAGSSSPFYGYSGTAAFGWISSTNSSTYKKVTTTNPYSSTVRNVNGYPVCNFITDRGNVIVFFGGITSGTTVSSNNEIGIIVQDKNYQDLENNTLIVYSTDGTMGIYTTLIYQNDKVINGKIYQRFNDVNFWDATNNVLIKNLSTYYGNGTNWVQIK